MATVFSKTVRWWEDGSATLYARITARDGTGTLQSDGTRLLKQADLSALSVKVFDTSSEAVETYTATLTISSVVFDTLQTDWDEDSTGYNFRAELPTTAFPTGGRNYQAEVKITTSGGGVGWVKYAGPAEAVHTS
jgi:hypothetical protein